MLGKQNTPIDTHSEWFNHTCVNTIGHNMLEEIEYILHGGKLTSSVKARIINKAQELTDKAKWPDCPLFCARAIQIMKSLAFIPEAEELCEKIFPILFDTWKYGLGGEEVLAQKNPNYNRILNPQKVLEGWISDLQYVNEKILPSYLRLLRLEGLYNETEHFGRAVTGYVSRIGTLLSPDNTETVNKSASVFLSEILESILSVKKELVPRYILETIKLIDIAVRRNPEIALQQETYDVRRVLSKLPNLIQRTGIDRLSCNRPSLISSYFEDAYKILNALHRDMIDTRRLLQSPLSELIPCLCGRDPRPLRRNGNGWNAIINCVYEENTVDLYGTVVDFAIQGNGVHIKWDDYIEDCTGFKNELVTIKLRNQEHKRVINFVNLTLVDSKDGCRFCCRAQALRGWRYEEKRDKHSKDAGIVFQIVNMHDDLMERIKQLPERSGLEPLISSHLYEVTNTTQTVIITQQSIDAPFEKGNKGLLEGIHDFLKTLVKDIRLGGFWNALWYEKNIPVKEKNIDALMRLQLDHYVRKRGAILTPKGDSGLGQCDYLIERQPNKLWIELKKDSGNWKQGIDKELVQHMLKDKIEGRPTVGLYLIFDFNNTFKENSSNLYDLLSMRNNTCQNYKCHIDIAIIKCDKPLSASVGNADTIEESETGLQYYNYTLSEEIVEKSV
ncbi:MAG: hypothetical protein JW787_12750 [Sedimentisphaerales bacterium]|nr:hypothetical protein [Sedimentisphaerales bacterium]